MQPGYNINHVYLVDVVGDMHPYADKGDTKKITMPHRLLGLETNSIAYFILSNGLVLPNAKKLLAKDDSKSGSIMSAWLSKEEITARFNTIDNLIEKSSIDDLEAGVKADFEEKNHKEEKGYLQNGLYSVKVILLPSNKAMRLVSYLSGLNAHENFASYGAFLADKRYPSEFESYNGNGSNGTNGNGNGNGNGHHHNLLEMIKSVKSIKLFNGHKNENRVHEEINSN